MGYYINKVDGKFAPSLGKVRFILDNIPGSNIIDMPHEWTEDIVCVVDNGLFEAAAYAFSPEELDVFRMPDKRRKTWLIVPNSKQYAE